MSDRSNKGWSVAGITAIVWALTGLFYTPHAQDFLDARLSGIVSGHLFRVDRLGRDMLSRLWRGSGVTVVPGLAASSLTLIFASLLLVAERPGPNVFKKLIRGIVSIGIALPVLFVGLLFLIFLESSLGTLVIAVAIGSVAFGYRQMRVIWSEQAGARCMLRPAGLWGPAWPYHPIFNLAPTHASRFYLWPSCSLRSVCSN